MTNKEKINTLVEMGFTVDEALALASGNYRSVPDPQPAKDPEPAPEPEKDAEPTPEPEKDLETTLHKFGKELAANIAQSIINSNIANVKQPPKMETKDILSLMLEPKAPEMGGTNGGK